MYATEDDFRDIAAVETLDVEPEEPQDETPMSCTHDHGSHYRQFSTHVGICI